uniref:Uncharacterized protein n=1 Tax=Glossina austeni TaxID=7395 RepID=A0A1A9UI22_GLOAU
MTDFRLIKNTSRGVEVWYTSIEFAEIKLELVNYKEKMSCMNFATHQLVYMPAGTTLIKINPGNTTLQLCGAKSKKSILDTSTHLFAWISVQTIFFYVLEYVNVLNAVFYHR